MAIRALRPCGHPGCCELVSERYCAKHLALHPAFGLRWAGSTTDRGYGYEWRKLRAKILKRDKYLCQICRIRQATDVDHIRAKNKQGTDDPANLQSLCRECHKEKTAKEDSK